MRKIRFVQKHDATTQNLYGQMVTQLKDTLRSESFYAGGRTTNAAGERTLDVSMDLKDGADVFQMFDLADRRALSQTGEDGAPLVRAFETVFVPGNWLRDAALSDESLGLSPGQVIATGALRVDYLRARQAAQPAPEGPLKILFCPMHENWFDRDGKVMSCDAAFSPFIPLFEDLGTVTKAVDPRNLMSKQPVTQELLDADVVITDYTATLYEAWALGKPVIFPRWLLGDAILGKAAKTAEAHIYRERIGHHPASFAELRELLSKGRDLPLGAGVDSFMQEYLLNYDGAQTAALATGLALEYLADTGAQPRKQALALQASTANEVSDHERAAKAYVKASAIDPFDAALLERLAKTAASQNNHPLEIQALAKLVALGKGSAQLLWRLGTAYRKMRRHHAAADAFREAIALSAKVPYKWYYQLGHVLETPGIDGAPDMPGANAAYDLAVQQAAASKVKNHLVGDLHIAAGNWLEAQGAFLKSIAEDPLEPRYYFGLARTYDRTYEWARAEEYYRMALALKPASAEWHYRLGFVLERQERFGEAAQAYLHAAAESGGKKPDWYYRAGYVLEQAGDFEQACHAHVQGTGFDLRKITPVDPYLKGFFDKRLAFYEDWRARRPDAPDVLQKYSQVLEGEGDLPAAAELFRKALLHKGALSEDDLKKREKLDALLRELRFVKDRLEVDCRFAEDWLTYAGLLERTGDLEGACDAVQQAIWRTDAHEPRLFARLGWLLTRCGRFEQACFAFRQRVLLQRAHGTSYGGRFKTDEGLQAVAIYREFFDTLPIEPETILYESFGGEGISDNPLALFEYVRADKRFKGWRHIWVIDDLDKVPPALRGAADVCFVQKESTLYKRYLCTAEYLINNATFPSYYVRKDGQRYLNTWHGTPLKTLGYDIEATPLQRANTARNLIQASMFIAPNQHTENVMLDRYGVRKLFTGRALQTGYPRIDMTINATDADKAALFARLGIDPAKPVVLFAPTYRGHWATPELEAEELAGLVSQMKGQGYNLLFRGHYFAEKTILDMGLPVTIAPHAIDTCKLLSIVDVLVSDYSSIFYDFLITGKPVIHYVHDWDYYVETRGVYFDKSALPGVVCEDEPSLIAALSECLRDPESQISEAYTAARQAYCALEDGKASARVVQALFFEEPQIVQPDLSPYKGHLLTHVGDMGDGPITRDAMHFLQETGKAGYLNTVLVDRRMIIDDDTRTARAQSMLEYADVVIRFGRACMTLEETWVNDKLNADPNYGNAIMQDIQARAMRHEARRLLGHAAFDIALEFDGTRGFWANVIASTDAEHHAICLQEDWQQQVQTKYPHVQRLTQSLERFDTIFSPTDALSARHAQYFDHIPAARFKTLGHVLPAGAAAALAAQAPGTEGFASFTGDRRKKLVALTGTWPAEVVHGVLDTVKTLGESGTEVALYLLDAHPDPLRLIDAIAARGLRHCVRLVEWQGNPFPYLAGADCILVEDSGQQAALEAAALGVAHLPVGTAQGMSPREVASQLEQQIGSEGLALVDMLRKQIKSRRKAPQQDVQARNGEVMDRLGQLLD